MSGGIISRLLRLFKSNAHDAIDKAEDPIKMMKLSIIEMEKSLNTSVEALAKAMGNQKSLVKQSEQYRLESESWTQKATQAIKTGQDDLAKKALEQKALAEKQYQEYVLLAQNMSQTVEQLKQQIDRMKSKLSEAKAKESIYGAKYSSAQAQKEIAQNLGGTNFSALSEFEKYEKKIQSLESEAEAMTELASNKNQLEREFEELETASSVSSDFEALRQQVLLEEQQKEQQKLNEKNAKIQQAFNMLNETSNSSLPKEVKKLDDNKDKKINDFFNS